MKTMIKKYIGIITLALLSALPVMSQGYTPGYLSIGWQYGSPFSTGFADKPSGYGMYFDAGYYIDPFLSVGGYVNYHTNYEYIPRMTYPIGETASLTTDQQHCIRQVPFGVSTRYRLFTGRFQPFIGLKLGANYVYSYSDLPTGRYYDDTWGFNVSPEVGVAFFPFKNNSFGFNISGYYSYSTNHTTIFNYDFNGMNTAGFRIGVIF